MRTCTLACDLPGIPRVRTAHDAPRATRTAPVRMLCVSTLEPRKNHRALLAAYELAVARPPGPALELDLVGAAYVGSQDIANAVREADRRACRACVGTGRSSTTQLQALYAACDFTVYPSVVEGFGLPVIESLWFGRPCVCANFGVMAENAAGGGCLTADVRDPQALADAMLDPGRRRRPARTIDRRGDGPPAQDLERIRPGSPRLSGIAVQSCLTVACRPHRSSSAAPTAWAM